MGWLARLFDHHSGGDTSISKNHSGNTRHKSRAAKAAPRATTQNYRAVTVYSRAKCCAAAERIAGRKFLAAHAPQLPLGGCSQPDQCQCRYQHLADRREESRRDTDHGLPARAYGDAERRHRGDRRTNRSAA